MTLAVPMIEVYCKQHYHTPYDAENHLVITLGNLTLIRGGLVVPTIKHARKKWWKCLIVGAINSPSPDLEYAYFD